MYVISLKYIGESASEKCQPHLGKTRVGAGILYCCDRRLSRSHQIVQKFIDINRERRLQFGGCTAAVTLLH